MPRRVRQARGASHSTEGITKILVADAAYESYAIEREVAASIGSEIVIRQWTTEDEALVLVGEVGGLIIRMQPGTRRVLEVLTRCRVIARDGTGNDSVDIATAMERGIVVAKHAPIGRLVMAADGGRSTTRPQPSRTAPNGEFRRERK